MNYKIIYLKLHIPLVENHTLTFNTQLKWFRSSNLKLCIIFIHLSFVMLHICVDLQLVTFCLIH